MSAAIALFTRELRGRTRLFVSCAVLACVPFLATLLPAAQAHRADVIAMVGGFLAICVGAAVALATGGSVIVRDLAERRMSFWFAKPLHPAALWFGKASAALLTCLLSFAIIAVPAMLAGGGAWKNYWLGETSVLGVSALGIAVLFLVSHAFATVVRSRSLLLALDFFFAVVAVGALLLLVWPVVLGGAVEVTKWLALGIAAAMLAVLAIAPVWQLERGRADIRRSHAAFSRFFWPGIGVVLLVAGSYVAWLVSAKPADLQTVASVEQAPRSTKVLVTGTAAGRGDYQSTFLLDRTTGSYERVATPPWWGIESSQDGKVLAWLQPSGLFRVRQLELHVNGRATGILASLSSRMVLSGDGARVAIDNGRTVTVYDVATGRIAGSAAGFDSRSQASMYFVTSDLLRVVETPPLRIAELDLRTRRLTRTGSPLSAALRNSVSVSGDGTRMFVRGPNVIADARSGAAIATLDAERYGAASMLHDGSVVAAAFAKGAARVHLYGPDGVRRHELTLPGTPGLWITGEVEGGRVLLTTRHGMLVVDVNRGVIVRKLDGVRGPTPHLGADPRLVRYGASEELVGRTEKGQLVLWQPEGQAAPRPLLR
ncbi:MAG TPA: hypothetical protein VF266_02160 [Thermoanaerobaculia bacterium]